MPSHLLPSPSLVLTWSSRHYVYELVPTDSTWEDPVSFTPPGNCNKVQRAWLFTVGRDIIKSPATRANPELIAGFLNQFGVSATAPLLRKVINAEAQSHRRCYRLSVQRHNRADTLRAVEDAHKRTVAQVAAMRNEPLAIAIASSTQNAVIRANMIMQQAAQDQPRRVRDLIKASHPVRIRLFPYIREQAEKTGELSPTSASNMFSFDHICSLSEIGAPLGTQSCVDTKGGHLINTLHSVVEYLLTTMNLNLDQMGEVSCVV